MEHILTTRNSPDKDATTSLALVTETWPPEINGVAMTLSRLTDGLLNRNWQVSLVRPKQRNEQANGTHDRLHQLLVPGVPIPGYAGMRFGLPVADKLRRHWIQRRPDIVHIATEGPLGWAAMAAARKLSIPVTSTFHTNFHHYCSHYQLGWLNNRVAYYLRQFHNKSSYTMAPSEALCQSLQQEGYQNVVLLGRGVDTHLFSPTHRTPSLRKQWGAEPDDLVVIHVGRLAAEKNLSLAAEAFGEIERANPRARMVWVGDGPEYRKLKQRHPRHIFTGSQSGIALSQHYASADLFLFASMTETFGNVVTEAMASGLAVVAFDYAAAAQYVNHLHNGRLASLGNQMAFIHHARTLARQPEEIRQYGIAARIAVETNSWDIVCDRFAKYANLAANSGRLRKTDEPST